MKEPINQKHRDLALVYSRTVRELGFRSRFLTNDDIIEIALKKGAPRFYVSFEAAIQHLRQFFSENAKPKKIPNRRARMWEDLRERVEHHINLGLCLNEAVQKAIDSPAPSFYVTFERARNMVSEVKVNAPWLLRQT